MASKTLAEYRSRVRRYLHEQNPVNSFWSDAFLNQLFNAHYRMRCSELSLAFEGYFTLRATAPIDATVVTDGGVMTWPAGLERLLKMELIRTNGASYDVARNERRDQGKEAASGSGDSYTPCYRPISQGFMLEPAPIAASGTLMIEYHGTPTDLELDTAVLHDDFPVTFDELLVLDTVIAAMDAERMLEFQGSVNSIIRLRNEWEVQWLRHIDRRNESTQKVRPFQGHYADA